MLTFEHLSQSKCGMSSRSLKINQINKNAVLFHNNGSNQKCHTGNNKTVTLLESLLAIGYFVVLDFVKAFHKKKKKAEKIKSVKQKRY